MDRGEGAAPHARGGWAPTPLAEGVGDLVDAIGHLVDAIGDLVDAIGDRDDAIGDRDDAIGDLLDAIGDRDDAIGDRDDAIGDLVDAIGDRDDAIGDLVDAIGDRVDAIGDRVDAIGDRVDAIGDRVDAIGDRVDAIGDRVDAIGDHVDAIGDRVDAIGDRVDAIGDRVDAIGPGGRHPTAWRPPPSMPRFSLKKPPIHAGTPRVSAPSTMRFRFDQFGKQLGRATLEGSGTATADAEITPDAQRADLCFEPDPARKAERTKLGLLGRLAATPCLIEIYSGAPSAEEVRACLHKHIAFWRARVREAQEKRSIAPPMLWILAAGSPRSALAGFGFVHARGFPAGVYRLPGAWRAGLVVASELPRRRSTLLVRLMSCGRGLAAAMKDLAGLPRDAPERALATRPVLRFARALTEKRRPTREEREFIMSTQDIVEELVEKGRREALREVENLVDKGRPEGQRIVQELMEKGRREGRLEGQRAGRLKEARAALRAVLARRGLAPSAEDEARIDACSRTATLRRWLDQAIDAASVSDALR